MFELAFVEGVAMIGWTFFIFVVRCVYILRTVCW